ncbi:MAG: hypothetical protein NZO16_01905 [Deltaproteobacteria bacterium]|nr:hypothetical protein [Deltaproteobacteria bacterium]
MAYALIDVLSHLFRSKIRFKKKNFVGRTIAEIVSTGQSYATYSLDDRELIFSKFGSLVIRKIIDRKRKAIILLSCPDSTTILEASFVIEKIRKTLSEILPFQNIQVKLIKSN